MQRLVLYAYGNQEVFKHAWAAFVQVEAFIRGLPDSH